MSIQSDTILEKEFKQVTSLLKSRNPIFRVESLPTPFAIPPLCTYVFIKGIEEPHFSPLNDQYSVLYKEKTFMRRLYWNDGTVRKEVPYKRNSSSVIIETKTNLRLKNSIVIKEKGYSYVDFREDPKTKEKTYYYEVPKSVVFLANMCSLVVSENRRAKHLGGEKITLKNGYSVYLYVLPLKNAKFTSGYKVLSIKASNDFKREINALKMFWRKLGIMFHNPKNFLITTQYKEAFNLVSEVYESDIEITKYNSISLAKDQTELEEFD